MGFDERRFISSVDEDIECPICKEVVEDPISSQCEHIFCKICIDKWLGNQKICPVDRYPLNKSQLCEPSRFFRNFYSKLIIKCKFESEGCKTGCKIEELNRHQETCKFNPILVIECEKGCGALLRRIDLIRHNCAQYLKPIIANYEERLENALKKESEQNQTINNLEIKVSEKNVEIRKYKSELEYIGGRLSEQTVLNRELQSKLSKKCDEINGLLQRNKCHSKSLTKIMNIILEDIDSEVEVSNMTNNDSSGIDKSFDSIKHCDLKSNTRPESSSIMKINILPEAVSNSSSGRSEGIIQFKIENFSKLRGMIFSPSKYIRDIPWRICTEIIQDPSRFSSSNQKFGFYLECEVESVASTWSIYANAEFSIISQKLRVNNIVREFSEKLVFNREKSRRGFKSFKSCEHILNPKMGYIKDDAIFLQVKVIADAPSQLPCFVQKI